MSETMARKTRGKTMPFAIQAARDLRRESTHAEKILWDALRGRRLGGLKFRRQHPLDRFILDMFCVEYQFAIEFDGGAHQRPEQAGYDETRSQYLSEKGIRVLRFINDEIENNLPDVLKRILDAAIYPSPGDKCRQERGKG